LLTNDDKGARGADVIIAVGAVVLIAAEAVAAPTGAVVVVVVEDNVCASDSFTFNGVFILISLK